MLSLETLGNATLLISEDGAPVLATDPWLTGTCYFGSWALDRDMTSDETDAVKSAKTFWISHGHPDHLHQQSLDLLPRGARILVPDHYDKEIFESLRSQGFAVEISAYRQWVRLSPSIRIMSIDNENQDAILLIEAGDTLIVNLNDSPWCGEYSFVRRQMRRYAGRTYVAQLCAIDADMLNIVDASGQRVIGPPDERKPGMIMNVARVAKTIGAANFLCSSSQHIYIRADSEWANPYRITWRDMQKWWNSPNVRLIEPFVKVNLGDGTYERKHPAQTSNFAAITSACEQDDWEEHLTSEEWGKVEAFVHRFETIRAKFDFIEFVVGGKRRRIPLRRSPARGARECGVSFHVPRNSLLKTIEWGYFDDLLIGNFMKTELHGTTLYPHFSPRVAKEGGNAKVYTIRDRRRFQLRYARRNPYGFIASRCNRMILRAIDTLRQVSEKFGFKGPLKKLYRWYRGDSRAS